MGIAPLSDRRLASCYPDVSNVRLSASTAIRVYYYVEVPPALGDWRQRFKKPPYLIRSVSPSAPLSSAYEQRV